VLVVISGGFIGPRTVAETSGTNTGFAAVRARRCRRRRHDAEDVVRLNPVSGDTQAGLHGLDHGIAARRAAR